MKKTYKINDKEVDIYTPDYILINKNWEVASGNMVAFIYENNFSKAHLYARNGEVYITIYNGFTFKYSNDNEELLNNAISALEEKENLTNDPHYLEYYFKSDVQEVMEIVESLTLNYNNVFDGIDDFCNDMIKQNNDFESYLKEKQ